MTTKKQKGKEAATGRISVTASIGSDRDRVQQTATAATFGSVVLYLIVENYRE
jgi:hypothetical protein